MMFILTNKLSRIGLSLILAVSLGAACGTRSRNGADAGEMGSRAQRKPERIVSLSPSNDEILCALVDEKRIAGLSKFSQDAATSYVSDAARRINVFVDRNAEQVVSLRPDLVLAARYTKVDLKGLLAETRTPLIVTTDFRNFADIEANIRLIGQAVGEDGRAESVIVEMRRKLQAARSRLHTGNEGLRVLYLASGNFSAGSGTSLHEILLASGLQNAAEQAGIKGHVKLASEQIMGIAPDVILIASGYERDRNFRRALENDPQLSAIRAIKEKRIVEVQARSVMTVSHHVADAVNALVDAVNQLQITRVGE